jgi:hypothetical protein
MPAERLEDMNQSRRYWVIAGFAASVVLGLGAALSSAATSQDSPDDTNWGSASVVTVVQDGSSTTAESDTNWG